MSKNIKYVMCGGLAFTEEKDMKKLSKLAKEGWILDSFKYLSYRLVKSKPEDIMYCVDYNCDKNDLSSYFEMFDESKWKYVCSYDGFHFFKAPVGTQPIYSDNDTLSLKYKNIYKDLSKASIYIILATTITGVIAYLINNSFTIPESIKIILYMLFAAGIGFSVSLIICNILIKNKITSKKLL